MLPRAFAAFVSASLVLFSLASAPRAQAQVPLGNFTRVVTPNGLSVLEIRMGSEPANGNLLFTAVITAGPISGSTNVMLQTTLAGNLLNPSATVPGFVVVRSAISAYSLGGGCGRGNIVDFPYINGSRPEILRITGTTHQVITLGLPGNDQYDSIDCVVFAGQTFYAMTNRTRHRLELRKEQGGMLVLVRDTFGNILTPFQGAPRPAFWRPFRLPTGIAPVAPRGSAPPGNVGYNALNFMSVLFMTDDGVSYEEYVGADGTSEELCPVGVQTPPPSTFVRVKETASGGIAAAGDFNADGVIDVAVTDPDTPGCPIPYAGPLGTALGGSQANWTGVTGQATHDFSIVSAGVFTLFEPGRPPVTQNSPFFGRGGPQTSCLIIANDYEGATLLVGTGTSVTQVQYSPVVHNLQDVVFQSELDGPLSFYFNCGKQ
jgi:hypothetical protein